MCYLKNAQIEGANASFPIGSGFGHVCVKTTAAQVRADRKSDLAG